MKKGDTPMKKRLGFLAVLLVFACVLTVGALAAGGYWQQNGDYWYYYNSDDTPYNGWLQDGGKWYYCMDGWAYADGIFSIDGISYGFTPGGSMATGWYDYNGEWYYFDANGHAHNGWLQDGSWWYYCQDGKMLADDIYYLEEGSYAFDAKGHMVTGWYYEKNWGGWFYYGSNGKPYTGWVQSGSDWYYINDGYMENDTVLGLEEGDDYVTYGFGSDGRMLKNSWYSISYSNDDGTEYTEWLYFGPNGKGYTGWVQSGGDWYYISNGWMLYDTVQGIEEGEDYVYYGFDAKGRMMKNAWYGESWTDGDGTEHTTWYYFGANGKGYTGWKSSGGSWYYLDGGYMYTDGVHHIRDGSSEVWPTYLFAKDGRMLTDQWYAETWYDGNEQEHIEWYYFGSNGKGYTGWLKQGGYTYYLNNGYMYADGMWDIGSGDNYRSYVTYRFDASGHLITKGGWYEDSWTDDDGSYTRWYYFDEGGAGHQGWLKLNGSWYYFDHGFMCFDGPWFVEEDKAYYNFAESGKLLTKGGWVSKDWYNPMTDRKYKQWFWFDSNGKGATGWYQDSSGWYYLNGGLMVTNATMNIDGKIYAFDSTGHMISGSGWKQVAQGWYFDKYNNLADRYGRWCYLGSDGLAQTGWKQIGGYWYYFHADSGIMSTYDEVINGYRYTFDENGHWDGAAGVRVGDD